MIVLCTVQVLLVKNFSHLFTDIKQLFSGKWNVKPRKDRQRKTWDKVVGDLFVVLGIDKGECLKEVERGIARQLHFWLV